MRRANLYGIWWMPTRQPGTGGGGNGFLLYTRREGKPPATRRKESKNGPAWQQSQRRKREQCLHQNPRCVRAPFSLPLALGLPSHGPLAGHGCSGEEPKAVSTPRPARRSRSRPLGKAAPCLGNLTVGLQNRGILRSWTDDRTGLFLYLLAEGRGRKVKRGHGFGGPHILRSTRTTVYVCPCPILNLSRRKESKRHPMLDGLETLAATGPSR